MVGERIARQYGRTRVESTIIRKRMLDLRHWEITSVGETGIMYYQTYKATTLVSLYEREADVY